MPQRIRLIVWAVLAVQCATARADTRINDQGVVNVAGEPFFPIGVYTYELDERVLKELRDMRFNTVVAGFKPAQLDAIGAAGMKAICLTSDNWLDHAAHPAILAWYLLDEPESNKTVPAVREAYEGV